MGTHISQPCDTCEHARNRHRVVTPAKGKPRRMACLEPDCTCQRFLAPRVGEASVGRVTQAGLDAGHVVEVEHLPAGTNLTPAGRAGAQRFRLVCRGCGWHTDPTWDRKRTFAEAKDHVTRAGRRQLLALEADAEPAQPGDPEAIGGGKWPGSEKWELPDNRRASNSPDAG